MHQVGFAYLWQRFRGWYKTQGGFVTRQSSIPILKYVCELHCIFIMWDFSHYVEMCSKLNVDLQL